MYLNFIAGRTLWIALKENTCIRTEQIDLAILDVMLPDVDGFTLCRKIREKMHENSRKPKFIKTVWGIGYKLEE